MSSENKEYCYRHAGGEGFQGRCASFEDAKEEAVTELDLEHGGTVEIAEVVPYSYAVDADAILERLSEEAYEEVGDPAEDWLTSVPQVHVEELQQLLTAALATWMEQHPIYVPTFYTVGESKEVVVGRTEQ